MFLKKSNTSFFKNVFILMTGTGIAQAIPIGLSPVLTRLYSPAEFGLFALYSGLASVLIVIATGRFELAVMLPDKDKDAFNLVKLSSLLSLVTSIVVFLIVLFWGKQLSIIFGNVDLYYWLFFLPITLFITGTYQSMNYWFNRKKEFKKLAKNRVMQSSLTGVSQTSFGFLPLEGMGLLLGTLIGQIVTLSSLMFKLRREGLGLISPIKFNTFKKLAIRFKSFLVFDVPTSLLNVGSLHAPNILFPIYFSSVYAGFFYLTQRVLQAPISLVASSVSDVFREEVSQVYRSSGQARDLFIKTFKWLVLLSLIPSVLLYFLIEDLFAFVFGAEWKMAGTYAKIMIPALVMRFITNPLSFMIYVAEKQIWNLVTMMVLASGVFLSFYLAQNPLEVIQGISLVYVIYYLIQLVLSAIFARVLKRREYE
jgi:O-antigen/teichoic acid export membrane protein